MTQPNEIRGQSSARVKRVVARLIRAEIDKSWEGSLDLQFRREVRAELLAARKAFNKAMEVLDAPHS